MSPAFSGLGPTVGTYAERVATVSPAIGQLFYQTDTDEYLKYVSYGGANRWMHVTPKANRNIVINGDFSVAQRSTASVALGTTSPAYITVDRWSAFQAGTANGTMRQETTSLPTQASNGITFRTGLRIGRNTAATTTGTINIQTAFETVDCIKLQGKRVTLSFWAKAGANYSGGALSSQVVTGTATDQSLASMSSWIGFNVPLNTLSTLTTNWVLYSYTGTISATAAQIGLHFRYTPSATPAGSDDYLYITGVQLETGSAPSDFEFEDFGTTLRKCQRYFQRYVDPPLIGVVDGTTRPTRMSMVLPVVMRANPTAAFAGTLNFFDGQTASGAFSSVQASWLKTTSVQFDFNLTVGFPSIGRAVILYINGGGTMSLSAEL